MPITQHGSIPQLKRPSFGCSLHRPCVRRTRLAPTYSAVRCLQKVGAYFKIKERNTTFSQELRGGLVTVSEAGLLSHTIAHALTRLPLLQFLTICYILPVNSGILTDTGGPCISNGAW